MESEATLKLSTIIHFALLTRAVHVRCETEKKVLSIRQIPNKHILFSQHIENLQQ